MEYVYNVLLDVLNSKVLGEWNLIGGTEISQVSLQISSVIFSLSSVSKMNERLMDLERHKGKMMIAFSF